MTAPARPTLPVEHELKTWPEFFACLLTGEKTFELRKDDRGFRVGHTLWLREWSPKSREYSGRELRYRVTYVLSGIGLDPGMVVMGIAPLSPPSTPPAQDRAALIERLEEVELTLHESTGIGTHRCPSSAVRRQAGRPRRGGHHPMTQPHLFRGTNAIVLDSGAAWMERAEAVHHAIDVLRAKATRVRERELARLEQRAGQQFREAAAAHILAALAHWPHGRPGEALTLACREAGIAPPNGMDDRAFGPVFRALSRQHRIVKVGTVSRLRGHNCSGGNLWKLAVK